MWEDLTVLFPGRVLHHTWAVRGDWGPFPAAYSRILISILCKSRATIDGVLPRLLDQRKAYHNAEDIGW